jgi:hypothetical protein
MNEWTHNIIEFMPYNIRCEPGTCCLVYESRLFSGTQVEGVDGGVRLHTATFDDLRGDEHGALRGKIYGTLALMNECGVFHNDTGTLSNVLVHAPTETWGLIDYEFVGPHVIELPFGTERFDGTRSYAEHFFHSPVRSAPPSMWQGATSGRWTLPTLVTVDNWKTSPDVRRLERTRQHAEVAPPTGTIALPPVLHSPIRHVRVSLKRKHTPPPISTDPRVETVVCGWSPPPPWVRVLAGDISETSGLCVASRRMFYDADSNSLMTVRRLRQIIDDQDAVWSTAAEREDQCARFAQAFASRVLQAREKLVECSRKRSLAAA